VSDFNHLSLRVGLMQAIGGGAVKSTSRPSRKPTSRR
jgi:hypothetical protein